MNEQDNPTPKKTVNWFRPHVKDLKAQENAQKEQLHPDTILGTLATAAFAGMAICTGGAHIIENMGTAKPMGPLGAEPPAMPEFKTGLRNSANRLRNGTKKFGRNAMQHADDIEQMLSENEKIKEEKEQKDQEALALAKAQKERQGRG